MLVGIFRECTQEYRETKDIESIRRHSLEHQMKHYSGRLRLLMRGTLWLTFSLLSFILTVIATGIGVIFANASIWAWITGLFSFMGLFLLAGFVVMEIMENHRAKHVLMLETAEFPNVLASRQSEESKTRFAELSQR
jgi:pheromone shutdown protein TraB